MSDKPNGIDAGALTKLDQALGWAYGHAREGLPGDSSVETFAGKYQCLHPDPEAAIDALIQWQVIKAGGAGFVTGIGGVAMLPIAIPVDLAVVLYIQFRMIEVIAHTQTSGGLRLQKLFLG
jgi:hypothetical protein